MLADGSPPPAAGAAYAEHRGGLEAVKAELEVVKAEPAGAVKTEPAGAVKAELEAAAGWRPSRRWKYAWRC